MSKTSTKKMSARKAPQIDLKTLSLTSKLALVIALVILVSMTTMIIVINRAVAKRVTASTDSLLAETTQTSVQQVNDIVSTLETINFNIQTGVADMYAKEDVVGQPVASNWTSEKQGAPSEGIFYSRITGDEIAASRFEGEAIITNAMIDAVKNHDAIVGSGVFFEPGFFSTNSSVYAPFINEEDLANNEIENLAYADYAEEDYYVPAKENLTGGYSNAYVEDGVNMVTAFYPIISGGKFKGIVDLDVRADIFSAAQGVNDQFPEFETSVINGNENIMYSTNTEQIGQTLEEVYGSNYASMKASMDAGQAFNVKLPSANLVFQFAPVQTEYETWWVGSKVPYSDYTKTTNQVRALIIGFSVIIELVLVILVVWLLRKSLAPLQEISYAAEQLARGNFDVDIKYDKKDEIGAIAMSIKGVIVRIRSIITDLSNKLETVANGDFNIGTENAALYKGGYAPLLTSLQDITVDLSKTMQEIINSAAQVNSGAEQISSGAQALAQGSTEQASSIELLSNNMQTISGQIKQTAVRTEEAAKLGEESVAAVQLGNARMQEMTAAMKEIEYNTEAISKIIKPIDDIAFQTNILSLNASIEAARAGQAGRGFAVVAGEVGNLAKKSQEAAQNTANLIAQTVDSVNRGAAATEQTDEALQAISENINKIGGLIDEITGATREQANGVSQVSQGIDQISSVVQTNSATAEQSAASSEELSGQANAMHGLIGKFRLNDEDYLD